MKEKQRKLLIELRSALIGEKNMLPYCIFRDETIDDLIAAQPKTMEELTQVKGFPEKGKRVRGFGEAILEIFNNTDKIDHFELRGSSAKGFEVGMEMKRIGSFD